MGASLLADTQIDDRWTAQRFRFGLNISDPIYHGVRKQVRLAEADDDQIGLRRHSDITVGGLPIPGGRSVARSDAGDVRSVTNSVNRPALSRVDQKVRALLAIGISGRG